MTQATAQTTFMHLGGVNRLSAMIGAHNITYDRGGAVTFHFRGCRKANIIKVYVNGSDLYNIEFFKFNTRSLECKKVKSFNDIYNSDLKNVIEEFTGLLLSL